MEIFYPWKIQGRYSDGFETEISGESEEDCMEKLLDLCVRHGDLEWYSGVCNENYEQGEYIGAENYIYD